MAAAGGFAKDLVAVVVHAVVVQAAVVQAVAQLAPELELQERQTLVVVVEQVP